MGEPKGSDKSGSIDAANGWGPIASKETREVYSLFG